MPTASEPVFGKQEELPDGLAPARPRGDDRRGDQGAQNPDGGEAASPCETPNTTGSASHDFKRSLFHNFFM